MKKLFLIILLLISSSIFSQTKSEIFESIQDIIPKGYSNISPEAMFEVKEANQEKLTLVLASGIDNTIEKNIESFELDFNLFEDSYTLPSPNEFKVITMFREPILIKMAKIDYQDVFHKEIATEDFKETNEIWFNFQEESDAVEFEKLLSQIKKLLNSN